MKLLATKTCHGTPISRKLASNFIELGYGLQVEGMAAEMFFNRSFEPFYPYRWINKLWFDLLEDENDPNSPYETDWRVFDWYHSSYEHNAWFAFPGVAGYQEIRDDSTFVIGDSPTADVHISLVPDNRHGTHAMLVQNRSEGMGGLAQDGKYCFPDVKYRFSGQIKTLSGAGGLYAALYREGTTEDPVCVRPLGEAGEDYTRVSAELAVEAEGRYTFVLLTPPHSEIVCDDFSLTPDDALHGFKKSAAEVGRYVSPKVIRWPGGCFASFYDWRSGVGKNRVPSYSYFWGGYQYNDIGTDELASYAETVGGESMICVNMHHPFKRYYDYVPPQSLDGDPNDRTLEASLHGRDLIQFSDLKKGAEEAAAWVEYCNGDLGTEGGRQRAANGREKPYNVKYWEMDNECHRWFRAEEYAEACVLYSETMKAVDPTIKIGMISYCYGNEALKKMIEIAGEHIDFLADRGFDENDLRGKLSILNDFNQAHGTNIKYCNTEWLPLNGADKTNMVPRSETRVSKSFLFSKWSYALDAATILMMWQRYGESIDFINFNNLANTHSQSVIETAKEGAFVTASGMMMHRFAVTKAYRTLVIRDYHPKRNDPVHVQVSEDEGGQNLVVNILNRSEDDAELELDLSEFSVKDGACGGVMLTGDSLIAMNRLNDAQIRESPASAEVRDGRIRMTVRRLSFAEYVLPLA
ncbi:MAG: hypothetical protein E7576_02880 [Ruminococcaceae bacterium]|nr:hypothetical protein [Oscillospiraceae bacterium]